MHMLGNTKRSMALFGCGEPQKYKKLQKFTLLKQVSTSLMVNVETEEFENITLHISGFPAIADSTFQ